MLFMFNFACEKIKIFKKMMTQYCKHKILTFAGVFERHILTYSICICLNLGLFRKDYLGHVDV